MLCHSLSIIHVNMRKLVYFVHLPCKNVQCNNGVNVCYIFESIHTLWPSAIITGDHIYAVVQIAGQFVGVVGQREPTGDTTDYYIE
ncbi:unnamed protein product [Medioppia subpectinata]|uniref:Uncharacterized protein n=1 Tax=Medioppia subpectinata TaxID=1979941 RepID=A0A7R9KHK0_9ACAR|nr:unnamed protein product [Medioppia subpectinata]CAG2103411.1 unnamed protein product [Medioppia subpectinata]